MSEATISDEQRRLRLGRRHHLAPQQASTSVVEVASSMAGLHATDPATVFLSVWARVPGLTHADIEPVLYEERAVVRMLGMRRTMFVVPLAMAPMLDLGCARDLAVGERRRTLKMLADAGVVEDPPAWLDQVAGATLEALDRRGEAVATELSQDVPELTMRIPVGRGTNWEGEIGVSTRVLFLLATQGRIVRGRPRGSWLSSQYRWAAMDTWVDLSPYRLDPEQAATALMERYLRSYGPVTDTDASWWTGWTKSKSRAALDRVGAVRVALEDGEAFVLADDLGDEPPGRPWVAFLPALDSTVMGWKQRSWYLPGPHVERLFDRNGNAGPTVWVDGRAVGAWAQITGGEVVYELLEDVGREQAEAVGRRAAELTAWLDGTVVMPRFPSPLQKDLAGRASQT